MPGLYATLLKNRDIVQIHSLEPCIIFDAADGLLDFLEDLYAEEKEGKDIAA